MSTQPDLGEQALSKAAEIALASQLDEVEEIKVDIRTNPFKLVAGELESVSVKGKGLVMQEDLRAERLDMRIGEIAIEPFHAAFGEIELKSPTNADACIILTEQDISRAFNSEYIREKLQNLTVEINGEPATVDVQEIHFRLIGYGKVALSAEMRSRETGEVRQTVFTAMLRMHKGSDRAVLEEVESDRALSPELRALLLAKASELLDLRNFELQGMVLQLKSLEVGVGQIMLQAQVYVEQFPS